MEFGPIHINAENMNGTPLFEGTDVPVKAFFEYLEDEKSVQKFMDDYPAVNRKDINEVLQMAKHAVTNERILNEIHHSITAGVNGGE
jgi:uncharacterized protein (DUF433 family)